MKGKEKFVNVPRGESIWIEAFVLKDVMQLENGHLLLSIFIHPTPFQHPFVSIASGNYLNVCRYSLAEWKNALKGKCEKWKRKRQKKKNVIYYVTNFSQINFPVEWKVIILSCCRVNNVSNRSFHWSNYELFSFFFFLLHRQLFLSPPDVERRTENRMMRIAWRWNQSKWQWQQRRWRHSQMSKSIYFCLYLHLLFKYLEYFKLFHEIALSQSHF